MGSAKPGRAHDENLGTTMIVHPTIVGMALALSFVLALLLTGPASAFAQDAIQERSQDVTSRPVASTTRSDREAVPPPPSDGFRLRFGLSAVGGGLFGAHVGGHGGLALRFGFQFNSLLALYYQGHALAGFYVWQNGDDMKASFQGQGWHQGILELTLLNFLQLGGGPSFDHVYAEGCGWNNQDPSGTLACSSGLSTYPGAHARVGLALGTTAPGPRGGLSLAADFHATFTAKEPTLQLTVGIGGELY